MAYSMCYSNSPKAQVNSTEAQDILECIILIIFYVYIYYILSYL